jgi:hypothetical protein
MAHTVAAVLNNEQSTMGKFSFSRKRGDELVRVRLCCMLHAAQLRPLCRILLSLFLRFTLLILSFIRSLIGG